MFNFFKKKSDPYKYKMLCKTCDIFFEQENCQSKICPMCGQSKKVEVYSVINKKNGQEIR